jgi:hypothetical protein
MRKKKTAMNVLRNAEKDLIRLQTELSGISDSDLKNRFSTFEICEAVTALGKAGGSIFEALRCERRIRRSGF